MRDRGCFQTGLEMLHPFLYPVQIPPKGGDQAVFHLPDFGHELLFLRQGSSAAADGVGARRSATKSHMVKSVSWPTAEITRQGGLGDGPGHRFGVERGQVLQGTAAPGNDDQLGDGPLADQFNGLDNLLGSGLSLDLYRHHLQMHRWKPAVGHLDDVSNNSTRWGR